MKVSILGGGGTRTPILVKGLLSLTEDFQLKEISIMDVDEERLLLIKKVLDEIARDKGDKVRLTYTQDVKVSMENAAFVICTICVGGDGLRIIDEKVPLSFGLLGQETTGPGGFAMAVRTLPRVLEIARLLSEINPDAWLINFTNPSGIVTQAILDHTPLKKVLGICDAPSSLHKEIAYSLGRKGEEVFIDYFGINHFGWIKGVYVDGKDLLPSMIEFLKNKPEFENITRFPVDFLVLIKMLPNPYPYYYYFKEDAVKELLSEEKTRGEIVKEINDRLFKSLKEGGNPLSNYINYIRIRESYSSDLKDWDLEEKEERILSGGEGYIDVALKVIKGLTRGDGEVAIVNSTNLNSIPGLKEDDVVEVPTLLRKNFIRPLSVGSIPEECLYILKQLKEYERLVVEGVTTSSYSTLVHALTLNPWVPSYNVAKKILDTFMKEESAYFPLLE